MSNDNRNHYAANTRHGVDLWEMLAENSEEIGELGWLSDSDFGEYVAQGCGTGTVKYLAIRERARGVLYDMMFWDFVEHVGRISDLDNGYDV